MYVYKTLTTESKDLTLENFETDTMKKPPYYMPNSPDAQYAICPACDNPIQILGLYKELAHTDKPYAKHYDGSIDGLAVSNKENYDLCPYANPQRHDKNSKREHLEGIPNKVIALIKDEFHSIMRYLCDITGININRNLARKMLKTYMGQEAYLYTGATLTNYPLMIAYFSNAQSLFRQSVRTDSALEKAIKDKLPEVALTGDFNNINSLNKFVEVSMVFIGHKFHAGIDYTSYNVFTVRNRKDAIILKESVSFNYHEYKEYKHPPRTDRDFLFLQIAAEVIEQSLHKTN